MPKLTRRGFIRDEARYPAAMTAALRDLLRSLP